MKITNNTEKMNTTRHNKINSGDQKKSTSSGVNVNKANNDTSGMEQLKKTTTETPVLKISNEGLEKLKAAQEKNLDKAVDHRALLNSIKDSPEKLRDFKKAQANSSPQSVLNLLA